ncbi:hypothetical protein CAEBREN_09881 [Caenorhabditis brenneri]|uniref:Uncharacterized protein n=1 Tax=Caenorhabditis brenneri TaxID=135651 RepID=G0NYB4_CAEBE|nr:hypothetical protein CAEBREN_09881 [Caenorhabditis brenneri]
MAKKKKQMDSVKVMAKDDAIEIAGGDEEKVQIVNQVLDELGFQMGEEMARWPSAAGGLNTGGEKIGRQDVAAGCGSGRNSGGNEVDDDLQARLDQLRRE